MSAGLVPSEAWSLCFLLLFPHSSWYRRFIFLFLVLVILLAMFRTTATTLTLIHLDSAAQSRFLLSVFPVALKSWGLADLGQTAPQRLANS